MIETEPMKLALESTPEPSAPPEETPAPEVRSGTCMTTWIALAIILLAGITLRVVPWKGYQWIGFDENLYKVYIEKLDARGLGAYPAIAKEYTVKQAATDKAF